MKPKASAFRHPDPGVDVPVPRDLVTAPIGPHERMTEEDAAKSLGKTQRPRHKDNRGQDPVSGGHPDNQ